MMNSGLEDYDPIVQIWFKSINILSNIGRFSINYYDKIDEYIEKLLGKSKIQQVTVKHKLYSIDPNLEEEEYLEKMANFILNTWKSIYCPWDKEVEREKFVSNEILMFPRTFAIPLVDFTINIKGKLTNDHIQMAIGYIFESLLDIGYDYIRTVSPDTLNDKVVGLIPAKFHVGNKLQLKDVINESTGKTNSRYNPYAVGDEVDNDNTILIRNYMNIDIYRGEMDENTFNTLKNDFLKAIKTYYKLQEVL
jgi:hypothetical protein